MKLILFTIIIAILSLVINAQEATFKGVINGLDSAEISVMILPLKKGEIPIIDKIHYADGKFKHNIKFN